MHLRGIISQHGFDTNVSTFEQISLNYENLVTFQIYLDRGTVGLK